jgi:hypothetical protein
MGLLSLSSFLRKLLNALLLVLPVGATAQQVDRLHCIAADMALTRGHDAMEGTQFIGADGRTSFLGKTTRAARYTLTPVEEQQLAPLVDELTPGAIEYVDLWLVGPGSVGRSEERVMTDKAQAFIGFVQECLDTFGPDMSP